MTDSLAEINARLEGIREIGMVVNAMRGIAASRAQHARNQLEAVDHFESTVVTAIERALTHFLPAKHETESTRARPALLLFCAEQGFAGAFNEHLLDSISAELNGAELFLVGTRGGVLARERGIVPDWSIAMSSRSSAIPKLAITIVEALFAKIATGRINRMDAAFNRWESGQGQVIQRRALFPLDMKIFSKSVATTPPLLNLAAEELLQRLVEDYIYAQICNMALHAFAAENQARMEAMDSASHQIEKQLADLQARQRHARQEEITSEIIELSSGETAMRDPL